MRGTVKYATRMYAADVAKMFHAEHDFVTEKT
jgi:hypothetical protein